MLSQLFSDKSLLLVITLVGMAMCTAGIGQVAARGDWLNPLSLVAYVTGALILLITGATLLGFNLPLIDSTRTAIFAVIALALFKVALTYVHQGFARGAP
jgi:hypothetical protein